MGRRNRTTTTAKSHTLPSSPTHSPSSSSFEFTISLSPHKSSAASADDLFYKGHLLPLHLSPRLRTLLLSSSSSSTTTSRSSTASRSSSDTDSSRPSFATDDTDHFLLRPSAAADILSRKPSKYFSLAKFSSVFRKEAKPAATVKRVSSTAREVLRKYLKKVKPLYEKLSQKQQQPPPQQHPPPPPSNESTTLQLISFSGNLSYPRRRSHVTSCPSSMMSSPRHGESGFRPAQTGRAGSGSGASSMEELQNAIQGAIAHCKNSMLNNNTILMSNQI